MHQTFTTYFSSLLIAFCFFTQLNAQTGPVSFGDTICAGDSAFMYVQAQSGLTYNWYDAASGGNLVGTGDTLFLGTPSMTTTYYVEAVGGGGSTNGVGPTDNSIASGSNYTFFPDGLVFTVQNDTVQLDTVFVYPNAAGNVVVNLTNTSNTVLQTATVAGSGSGFVKTAIPVEFCIPPGTYRLNAVGTTTNGLFRNTGGAQYPYTSTNINITGAINTSTTFYYFFYDWKYRVGCGGAPPTGRSATTVVVNPNPIVNFGPDPVLCPNNTIQLNFGGGNNTYLWSDSTTGPIFVIDSAGTYWGECTDPNGCSDRDTLVVTAATVTDPGLPDDTIYCGDPITLCATGGSSTCFWNTGATTPCITVNNPGVFVISCIDSLGCSIEDTTTVTLVMPPNATFMADTFACPMIDFTVLAVTGNDTYTWDFGDSTGDTLPTPSHTYTQNGTYTVTLITTGACGSDTMSQQLVINCIVGLEDGLPEGYTLYPNPSHGQFFLEYPVGTGELRLQVFNLAGSEVWTKEESGQLGKARMEMPLAKGMYFLRIERDGMTFGQKIIVE